MKKLTTKTTSVHRWTERVQYHEKVFLRTGKHITGRFSAYCNTISQTTVSVINVLNLPVTKNYPDKNPNLNNPKSGRPKTFKTLCCILTHLSGKFIMEDYHERIKHQKNPVLIFFF